MSWTYKGREITCIEDLPDFENIIGFIYLITRVKSKYGPAKIYIGKKSLAHRRKVRISKREKKLTSSKKVFKVIVKESDWFSYWGSSDILKEDMKIIPEKYFKREILELCKSKKYLTYCELHYQVLYNVLRTDSYNGNILSRYFRKDMEL